MQVYELIASGEARGDAEPTCAPMPSGHFRCKGCLVSALGPRSLSLPLGDTALTGWHWAPVTLPAQAVRDSVMAR